MVIRIIREEEFEFAPGLKCTVRFEDDSDLLKIANGFRRRKVKIGKFKKTLRAWDSPRYPDRVMSPRRVVINSQLEVE
jgi:hypothetical protein